MKESEELLVMALTSVSDLNLQAILVQNYIQEVGALSEDAAEKVKEIFSKRGVKTEV